jgi:hypothetical protein
MKTLISTLTLLLFSTFCFSQVILTYNPIKAGIGLFGCAGYSFASYEQGVYPDHSRTDKICAGIAFHRDKEQYLCIGPAFDTYKTVLPRVSFELSGFVNIRRISVLVSVDPIKLEGKFGIGINFLSKRDIRNIKALPVYDE